MNSLKEKLDRIYENYTSLNVASDPLQIVHHLSDKEDIETFAFLASVFSYGNVKQINSTLQKIIELTDSKPYHFIKSYSVNNLISIKHRFYSEEDVHRLFLLLNQVLKNYDSLYNLFIKGYSDEHKNVKQSISAFSNYFLSNYKRQFGEPSLGIKFMLPLPEKGSACKRMNLFLRWMIRKDKLDFGLWNSIPRNKLVIPVDTHIAQISKRLKLTKRKNISWKMAEEITENLKRFDEEDPIKYDFSLCHFNMIYKKLPQKI